jgi:hypothetical protein
MPTAAIDTVERTLKRRLTRFLQSRAPGRRPLILALRELAMSGWEPILFGGFPRDLAILRGSVMPRDIDIVLGHGRLAEVLDPFAHVVKRQTRFGGSQLAIDGWRFDLWPLEKTWAFREGLISPVDISTLPLTTFLTVEAIAVDLVPRPGTGRRVFEHKFFESLRERVVDINLEDNPYPALCVIRTLLVASKLDFAISGRLMRYIAHYAGETDIEPLLTAQSAHYGVVRRDSDQLHSWLKNIRGQVKRGRRTAYRLPANIWPQLELWKLDKLYPFE